MSDPADPADPIGPIGLPGPARPAGPTALVPLLVRLKLALLRNGLRQSTGRRAFFVVSAVLALLFAALQLIGLIALRGHAHAGALGVCLTAVMALGWAFFPLFFPSGDETMDPTRLAMLPLRPRPLIVALLAASLVGIGPLFTVTLVAGAVASTAYGAGAALVAAAAAVLAVLVCVALARAVATANVRLLTSRKGRDLALLSGLVIAVGIQVVNLGMQKLTADGEGLGSLEPIARVLRWIPPASAVDAVRAASGGDWGRAATGLALAAVAVGALLWWWQRTLTRLMTAPDASTVAAAEPRRARTTASGLAALLPAGRTGAVMQRTLRYAWRDPKTKAGWAAALGVGLLLPVISAVQGKGSVYLACWAAGMLGLQMYNQFGQDSSAFWTVAATVSSRRDAYLELRGRALALLLVAVPYVALVVLGSAALFHDWGALPQALGVAFALLGSLVATGAVSSVSFPYSIPQDTGFKNVAPGQGGIAFLSILAGIVTGGILCTPLIAALLLPSDAAWILLPLGALYGWALTEAGLRFSATRLPHRLPEVLTAVTRG